jgi:hypothetical protein
VTDWAQDAGAACRSIRTRQRVETTSERFTTAGLSRRDTSLKYKFEDIELDE